MMTEIKTELERQENLGMTENGALGYKSTKNHLVDLNFKIPFMRGGISQEDVDKFVSALHTNFEYAVKWLFFLRDVRSGMGERDTFVKLFKILFENCPIESSALIGLISEYGRWDDVVSIAFSGNDKLQTICFKEIEKQLK